MPREVHGPDATWSCAQAYAGLEELKSSRPDASQKDGLVWVTATPNGGAQSVRLHLRSDWKNALSDEDLLRAIAEA